MRKYPKLTNSGKQHTNVYCQDCHKLGVTIMYYYETCGCTSSAESPPASERGRIDDELLSNMERWKDCDQVQLQE